MDTNSPVSDEPVQKSERRAAPGVDYWAVEYKYITATQVEHTLKKPLEPGVCIYNLVDVFDGNRLVIYPGYAWDGPSGPAVDTPKFMLPSLVHDVLYQMMREGVIPPDYKRHADKEMRRLAKATGMWAPRRWWSYTAVKWFGGNSAK